MKKILCNDGTIEIKEYGKIELFKNYFEDFDEITIDCSKEMMEFIINFQNNDVRLDSRKYFLYTDPINLNIYFKYISDKEKWLKIKKISLYIGYCELIAINTFYGYLRHQWI